VCVCVPRVVGCVCGMKGCELRRGGDVKSEGHSVAGIQRWQ
jgi:hypothetical protein